MKRPLLYAKLWNDCRGLLPAAASVAVAGGGLSGAHLALALAQRGCDVTLFEPAAIGGVRIPVMHACQSARPGSTFWQTAAAFSRSWYLSLLARGFSVHRHASPGGDYFTVNARHYLRYLYARFCEAGGKVRHETFAAASVCHFQVHFVATGSTHNQSLGWPLAGATQIIRGLQSYASRVTGHSPCPPEKLLIDGRRFAIVHRSELDALAARREARELVNAGRYALFSDQRLVTRDRLPVVGFAPRRELADYHEFRWRYLENDFGRDSLAHHSPFLFQGMGYHAMTYAPFLAATVSAWLSDGTGDMQNLICALTPARFLTRR